MKRSLLLVSFFAISLLLFSQVRVYTPALRAPADSAVNQMPDVYLSWYAITGSLNLQYQVQLDSTPQFISPLKDSTLHLLTGYHTRYLIFNKTYYWRVRAIDNGNTSAWSPTRSFTVFNTLDLDLPTLADPNDTALVPNITLKWKGTISNVTITGVTSFDLQIDSTMNFSSPILISKTVSNTVISFICANLRFGVVYYWRVRAKHAFSNSSWGTAWTTQKSNTTINLASINFFASYGFAVGDGGMLLKSIDLGKTWDAQNSTTTVNLKSVYFKNTSTGIVAGDGGKILWSKNSGVTWKAVPSGTTNNLSCVSYLGGTAKQFYIAGDAGTILTATNDTVWTAMTSGSSANLRGIHFISSTVGFAAGDNGTILSYAGSNNWNTQNSGTSQNLSAVYFVNATTGFVVGNSGTILKTTNGGNTWTAVISGTSNNLFSVKFITPLTGIISGAGGTMLKTTNGGVSWFLVPGFTSLNLNSIMFTSNINGYAVGQNGLIASTTTGGGAWSFKVVTSFIPLAPDKDAVNQMLNVALTSTKYTGLLAYMFQVATDQNFNNIVYQTETQDSSVNASYLQFGIKYYWRVAGRHLTDTSNWSVTQSFTTINTVNLISPANNAVDVSVKPQLRWTAQTGIANFILELGPDPSFTTPLIRIYPKATDNLYNVLLKLSQGTIYYWRMRAVSDGTLTADTSNWSPVWSFTTLGPQGINEPGNPSFRLYPNPSAGKVFLDVNSNKLTAIHFVLFDLLGKKVFDQNIEPKTGINSTEIILSGIGEGIYIARITSGEYEFNQKIIIK